jgi:hypothetical protein
MKLKLLRQVLVVAVNTVMNIVLVWFLLHVYITDVLTWQSLAAKEWTRLYASGAL